MLLAKIACGFACTVVLAGAYTFREGVIRISVDEHKLNGEHHHLIVPAAAIPLAARFVPDREIQRAAEQASLLLPALREFAKQLRKMPDADLVEIRDNRERVQIRAEAGRAARSAGYDSRYGAEPRAIPHGLQVSYALPAQDRRDLRTADAARARCRQRPRDPLPHSRRRIASAAVA